MAEQFDAYHEWLGIPPKDQPPTYYRLLGVDEGESNLRVIENAADRQMAHVRTFQTGKHAAISQKLLNQIAAAKVCLLNVEKKAAYDTQLAAKAAAKSKQAKDSAVRVAKPVAARPVAQFAPSLPSTTATNATLAELDAVIDRSQHRKTVRRKPLRQRPTVLGGAAIVILAAVGGIYFALMPPAPSNSDDTVAQADAKVPSKAVSPVGATEPDSKQSSSDVDNANVAVAISEADQTAPTAVESVIPQRQSEAPTAQNEPGRQQTEESTPADEIPDDSTDLRAEMDQTDGIELPSDAADDKPDTSGETPDSASPKSPAAKPALVRRPAVSPAANAPKPQKVVNLLKLIDLRRDRFGGEPLCDGKTLTSAETLDGDHQLQIPYRPGAREYQLTVVAEPVSGQPRLNVGLYGGNTQCVLSLYNTYGTLSNVAGNYKSLTGLPRDMFARGKQTTLTFVVRAEGFQVLYAGQPIVQQVGYQSISSNQQWNGPDARALAIGWNFGAFRITKLELRVLKQGAAPDQPVANLASAQPQQFLVAKAVPQNRAALPSADDQARALEQVRDVFKAEYAKAKKPDEKADLAEKLLQQGIDTQDDVAASYVLLKEARDMSAAAGNLTLAVRCVEALTDRFEIDRFDGLQQAVAEVAKHTSADPAARLAVVEAALELMNAAATEGRFDAAGKLATTASGMSAKLKDAALKKRVQVALADVKKQKTQFAAIQELKDKLEASPDDADANLKLGKHLCLIQGDWEKGLSHLAKGGDEKYAPLALQELAKPDTAEAQIKLADAWWDLSASEPAATKPALMARAGQWYQIALPEISGLGKVKIEKRLEQLGPAENSRPTQTVAAEPHANNRPGVKGRTNKVGGVGSALFGSTNLMQPGELDRHVGAILLRLPGSVCIVPAGNENSRKYLNNGDEMPEGDWRVYSLHVAASKQIFDAELEPISRLDMLRELVFFEGTISDVGLAHLQKSKSIRRLELYSKMISDRGLESIGKMSNLESLSLRHMQITDAGLSRLSQLAKLRSLSLEDVAVAAPGMKSLEKLAQLEELSLKGIELTDAQLGPLAKVKQLGHLSISDAPITGDFFRTFASDSTLNYLELTNLKLTDAGFKNIAGLRKLNMLRINRASISETAAKHLSELPMLSSLWMSQIQLSDRAFSFLASAPTLQQFGLFETAFVGEGLRISKPLDQMTYMGLLQTRIGDVGVKQIVAAMPNLDTLDLSGTAVSDIGMKHLAGLRQPKNLYLNNTAITDKGVMELKGIVSLRNLGLPKASVSPAAVEKLRQFLPMCNIHFN